MRLAAVSEEAYGLPTRPAPRATGLVAVSGVRAHGGCDARRHLLVYPSRARRVVRSASADRLFGAGAAQIPAEYIAAGCSKYLYSAARAPPLSCYSSS